MKLRLASLTSAMRRTLALVCVAGAMAVGSWLQAGPLDEMSLERWGKLREAERYQMQIAEKYFREQNWKAALGEYEKFLTLYEMSEGASFAQLKWSLCQIHLKKLNTAIKDGFQSCIDYWPDSPEAVTSAYLIGRTYKDLGETKKAKKAYEDVTKKHPTHFAAAMAMSDVIDIAEVEGNDPLRVEMWKKLSFDFERKGQAGPICVKASQQYTSFSFYKADFLEATKAIESSYKEEQIPYHVWYFAHQPISTLTGEEKTKAKGEKLADQTAAYVREKSSTDVSTPEKKTAARNQWLYIADVQAASRRADKVREAYNSILKQFGADDEILGRLANWLKTQNKYDEARTEYAKFQNKIEGTNQIAYSFRQERKVEQAVQAYQRNAAADTENASKWHGEIAQTYREANKWNEAVAVYQELIKSDTKKADQWMWLMGITHRDAGQYKEAIGVLRQCNNFPQNYQVMADCHRHMKQYGEAVILYGQIVAGSPAAAPAALLQIGFTHEQAGDKDKAISAFQQVCKKFPTDSHASQAHAHLQTKYKINVTLGGAKDEK